MDPGDECKFALLLRCTLAKVKVAAKGQDSLHALGDFLADSQTSTAQHGISF